MYSASGIHEPSDVSTQSYIMIFHNQMLTFPEAHSDLSNQETEA